MTPDRKPLDVETAKHRSRVTNGSAILIFGDGRSAGAKRYRDLLQSLSSELGGMDVLPESTRQIVRRAAQSSVECELLEARRAAGEEVDPALIATLSNANRRAIESMGKLAKSHKPRRASLADHLAANYSADRSEGGER